jgi:foldase protein PrsA
MLQAKIEAAISTQPGISPGQADEIRKRMNRQFSDPQARAQLLHQIVASQVLAAEAKEAGLDQSPEYRQQLLSFADDLLASTLVAEEVAKRATLTPQDVERFFEAGKEDYAEPATVTLAHIVTATEEEAREVLARAEDNGDFAELAAKFSIDQRTREDGGRLPYPLAKGDEFIPGIGQQAELMTAVWAVKPPAVLSEVYATEAGWHVVQVVERTERVEKALEQVREQVERDARAARQREVTQQYLRELFDRREVKLYPEAFLMTASEQGEASP